MRRGGSNILHGRLDLVLRASAATLRGPKYQLDVLYPGGGICTWLLALDERAPMPEGAKILRVVTPPGGAQ